MNRPVLYCGDTDLATAASYLAGVLTHAGQKFQYLPSSQPLGKSDLHDDLQLVILSDYRATRISSGLQQRLRDLVEQGTGLLMIGGWESFHGLGGDWDGTPVADLLPVAIASTDDRLNSDQPLLVRCLAEHPATVNLPWASHPPYVGGLNRFTAKASGQTLLEAERLEAERLEEAWSFEVRERLPLLVVGECGRGRTAALATDLAPHWVGGLVDWGPGRISAQAESAEAIEVGDLYAQFVRQLILWTKG